MNRIKLSQKQRKIIYTILLLIIFLSYFDAVMDMTLFKCVPITQIFSADRYRVNSLNLIPFADWNVDRGGMFRDILLNVLLFFSVWFFNSNAASQKQDPLGFNTDPVCLQCCYRGPAICASARRIGCDRYHQQYVRCFFRRLRLSFVPYHF